MCEKFNRKDYAELFKYMTKETDENDNILTYDNFVTLYEATYHVKQIKYMQILKNCYHMMNYLDVLQKALMNY